MQKKKKKTRRLLSIAIEVTYGSISNRAVTTVFIKCLIILSNFNQNSICSTEFGKTPKYKIWQKRSWETNCSTRTDKWTCKQTDPETWRWKRLLLATSRTYLIRNKILHVLSYNCHQASVARHGSRARGSKGRFTHSMPFPCRAHAVPLPCRAAKGLECVFPIWFT